MLDRVRNILRRLYIDVLARELWRTTNRILVTFKRKFGRLDRELIDKYVSAEEVRKLHVGCGEKTIDGWLNADFSLRRRRFFISTQLSTFRWAISSSTTFLVSI